MTNDPHPDAAARPERPPLAGPVRVAIVGCGRVAGYHAAGYARLDGVEIVGLVDRSEAKARAFGLEHASASPAVYTDLGRMLREQTPHLVSVCTPPGTHAEVAAAVLESGAWAYVEKPLCQSLAAFDRLERLARLHGGRCCGVFQWRSAGSARAAVSAGRGKVFGRLLAGACLTCWFRDDAYYAVPWRGTWAGEVGGTLVSHAIHALDLLLAVGGDWREVRATARTVARQIEVEDVAAATVEMASGAVVGVLASALSPRQQTLIRFDFDRATLELDHFTYFKADHWRLTPAPGAGDAADAWTRLLADHGDAPPQQGTQLAQLVDDLRHARGPETCGHELRRTLELLSAIYKSAATGRPVACGEIASGDPWYDGFAGPAASSTGSPLGSPSDE